MRVTPTGSTRVAAVIGTPIAHSLSPLIHNAAFAAAGLDWVYVALQVAEGRAGVAVAAMRDLDLGGLSVTMPHKTAAAGAVERLSTEAAALGAVNCVAWEDGCLVGHNTDGDGFLDALRSDLGVEPAGRRIAVIGAGGAGRAVVRAVAAAGASEIIVVNRTPERAVLAASLGGSVGRVGTAADVTAADIVVNATSVGMDRPTADDLPVPVDVLRPGQVVADLVYRPLVTPLLRAATQCGATTLNGVGMLLHQAARAFTLWTGAEPPLDAMRAVLAEALLPDAAPEATSAG